MPAHFFANVCVVLGRSSAAVELLTRHDIGEWDGCSGQRNEEIWGESKRERVIGGEGGKIEWR